MGQVEQLRALLRDAQLIAVSGGSVIPIFKEAIQGMDNRWQVFLVDERLVPPNHPDSNYGQLKEACPQLDLVWSLEAAEYTKLLGGRVFDLVILGMGLDGHTASLFPGHSALQATEYGYVEVDGCPKPPARRLTLTLPTINGSRRKVLLIAGAEKQAVFAQARSARLPISLVTDLEVLV